MPEATASSAIILAAFKEAGKHIVRRIPGWLRSKRINAKFEKGDIEQALSSHLRFVSGWSSDLIIPGLEKTIEVDDIFVKPDFSDGTGTASKQRTSRESYRILLKRGKHKIVYGHPGAGKTTVAKKVCRHLLFEAPRHKDPYDFPIVIPLRALRRMESVSSRLLDAVGVNWLSGTTDSSERLMLVGDCLETLLEGRAPLIILDGLDELIAERQEECRNELATLTRVLKVADIIVTARTQTEVGEVSRSLQLTIEPFDKVQIDTFVKRWFCDDDKAAAFLNELAATPLAGTERRPLTLATFCMLYDVEQRIPTPPRDMYRRIVNLYLERWDRHRNVSRGSAYARFGVDEKREFLSAMAFALSSSTAALQFDATDMERAYLLIYERFALPRSAINTVIKEIESHNGLIHEIGVGRFQFYHKSIQEYLIADEIVRQPMNDDLARKLINMPDACAIAVALSSARSAKLLEFVRHFEATIEEQNLSEGSFQISPTAVISPFLERLHVEDVNCETGTQLACAFLLVATICESARVKRFAKGTDLLDVSFAKFIKTQPIAASMKRMRQELRMVEQNGVTTVKFTRVPSTDWRSGREFVVGRRFRQVL